MHRTSALVFLTTKARELEPRLLDEAKSTTVFAIVLPFPYINNALDHSNFIPFVIVPTSSLLTIPLAMITITATDVLRASQVLD